MRHLLLLLIQTVARFLRNCADLLATLGRASEPADGELPAAGFLSDRAAGPPDDWLRKANPSPPAHWVELVRRRAPGFLGEESRPPDLRARVVRSLLAPSTVRAPLRLPSSAQRDPAMPTRAGETTDVERTGLSDRPPDSTVAQVPEAPPATPRRPVRIVTVIEENRRKKPEKFATSAPSAADPGLRHSLLGKSTDPEVLPGEGPSDLVLPARKAFAAAPFLPEPPSSLDESLGPARREEPWKLLPGPVFQSPSRLSEPEFPETSEHGRSEGGIPGSLPEVRAFPSSSRKGERGQSPWYSSEAARWPELPASAESDDLEDARVLYRELRRQALLEDEQRGTPWSA